MEGVFVMKDLTTGSVARICKVAPRTVSKWVDSGRLRGHLVPGGVQRRIPREYLLRFLKVHGMPTDEAVVHVVAALQDQGLGERIKKALGSEFKVAVVGDTFNAGVAVGSNHTEWLILDTAIGSEAVSKVLESLPPYQDREMRVIVIRSQGEDLPRQIANANLACTCPFDVNKLADRIKQL
jgi:excisionase family DNA binding protein